MLQVVPLQISLLTAVFHIIFLPEFSSALIDYRGAKNVVKLLERVPPLTDDPFNELLSSLDKILNRIGIGQALNGNADTNQAKVDGPVRVTKPPISAAIYYYHYALASTCESSLEQWNCYYCQQLGSHIKLVTVYTHPYYHSKWFVAIDNRRKEIVLVFRPSYNAATIFVSLTAILKKVDDSSGIMIHTGFMEAVLADFDRIVAILQKVTKWNPTYKLIITGLSLGGEMSSVMTFFVKYRNVLPDTVIELYTYGQARCGNRAYANYMNNLTMAVARVTNTDDLVVRIAASALGYYHHHNELFLLDDGQGNRSAQYCSTEYYEAPECAQSRGPSLLITQSLFNVIDHVTYFSIDAGKCLLGNPIEFFLQLLWPLRSLIPVNLLDQLPKFAIDSNIVLDYRYLLTAGIRNLYKVASKSSTYYQ